MVCCRCSQLTLGVVMRNLDHPWHVASSVNSWLEPPCHTVQCTEHSTSHSTSTVTCTVTLSKNNSIHSYGIVYLLINWTHCNIYMHVTVPPIPRHLYDYMLYYMMKKRIGLEQIGYDNMACVSIWGVHGQGEEERHMTESIGPSIHPFYPLY